MANDNDDVAHEQKAEMFELSARRLCPPMRRRVGRVSEAKAAELIADARWHRDEADRRNA
jgi:hypothetical protein